jgi:hypothetical protein
MTGWLTNNELNTMWKEGAWPKMGYFSGIFLEGLMKIVGTVVGL